MPSLLRHAECKHNRGVTCVKLSALCSHLVGSLGSEDAAGEYQLYIGTLSSSASNRKKSVVVSPYYLHVRLRHTKTLSRSAARLLPKLRPAGLALHFLLIHPKAKATSSVGVLIHLHVSTPTSLTMNAASCSGLFIPSLHNRSPFVRNYPSYLCV